MPGFTNRATPALLPVPPGTLDPDGNPVTEIPYWVHFPRGFSEAWTERAGSATKAHVFVDWKLAALFKSYALGFAERVTPPPPPPPPPPDPPPPPPPPFLTRHTPVVVPWTEGGTDQFLEELSLAEVGSNTDGSEFGLDPDYTGWPAADWARYECTFRDRPWQVLSDAQMAAAGHTSELYRYVIRRVQDFPRERQVNAWVLGYMEGGDFRPLNQPGFVPDLQETYLFTWVMVPTAAVPRQAIRDCKLKVNATTFDAAGALGPGFGGPFAAKTVLFARADGMDTPYKMPDGNWACDLTYTLKFDPIGWNKARVFNTAAGATYVEKTIQVGTTGNELYETADLNTLFVVE